MRCALTPFLAILLLALMAPLAVAQVHDEAGFFTPNAVERADQLISQLRQKTGRGVLIETLPALPADEQAQLQSLGSGRFFPQYANQRAKQAGVSGVYVLVTREPSHLQVAVGDQTQRAGLFSAADRDRLRDTLLTNFRAKNYDQGLLEGVAFVQSTMSAGAPNNRTLQTFPGAAPDGRGAMNPRTAPEPRTGHSAFFWLVVLGGGGLLLLLIVRRLAARAMTYSAGSGYPSASGNVPPPLPGQPQQPGTYPGYGAGGGGGGFGRGLLGGLLGGAAGGWLYDRMSHRADASYPGQNIPPTTSNPDIFPPAPPDQDFSSSSGDDFGNGGDSGGGGDF